MLVYVLAFLFFLLFAAGLALPLILKRGPIKSEDEATQAILDGLTCASCHGLCEHAGGKTDHSSSKCKAERLAIAHQRV